MDLAYSESGSCSADFAKGELHPALSLDSEPCGLEAAPPSRSNELGTSESSTRRLSAAERNSQAQKRFRQRQKERSHTAAAKLLETTAQLEELQVKQRQLEASELTLPHFGRLWKEYVQKLGACLLNAKEDDNDPFSANVNKWAAEATSLMDLHAVLISFLQRASHKQTAGSHHCTHSPLGPMQAPPARRAGKAATAGPCRPDSGVSRN
ncbi:hypothetical protein WJX77_009940 [Trebouxia sp. C0004]